MTGTLVNSRGCLRKRQAKYMLVVFAAILMIIIATRATEAQGYSDPFSKMIGVTTAMNINLTNQFIHANRMRLGTALKQIADAPSITQEEVEALCRPFPCSSKRSANSSMPDDGPDHASKRESAARSFPITATDFQGVGGRILPDEIGRSAAGTPEQRQGLRYISNQYLDQFEKEGRPNNMANAFAFVIEASLQIATGKSTSDEEEKLLIDALNNSIAPTPQFASMSPRDKQVLYESAIVTAGLMLFLDQQGKQSGNADMQRQARDTAKNVIASFFHVRLP
jgi:hypothetical protein